MQFHLNGFQPGDPAHAEWAKPSPVFAAQDEVDVLIVGCGPTGLTLAAQLAAFPDIRTRIVEQRPGPLLIGQADGVACRSMEMYEAFGFSERVLKEAYWVNEAAFWKPDEARRQHIVRGGRVRDTEDGISEFPHVILSQARIHDFLLDVMRQSPARLEPTYSRRFLDLKAASARDPMTVTLERLEPAHQGQVETIKARYVVGCEGARSAVRGAIGRALKGDSANQAWGVMDVLAVTDFPDIRLKAMIQSADEGSILIIPREGGYMVRLYIELDKLNPDERLSSRAITADDLIAAAQRILRPYTLDVREIVWWSVYEIGQRLCDRFDDQLERDAPMHGPRVFIAGDACHTHSPKAGQGMNVSMADAFNLGWKLAAVIRGQSSPRILATYSDERQAVAQELIDFDRDYARMISAPPKDPADPASEGVDPAELQANFVKKRRFAAGVAVHYPPSILVGEPTHQPLARGLTIGMRFHSALVIRLADARTMQLGHAIKADGRWRLFAFGDAEDPARRTSRLRALCDFLAESAQSPVRRFTPAAADIDSVIDVRAILQQGHRKVAIGAMPSLLTPRKGRYGLQDYDKIFCAEAHTPCDFFDLRGIDRDRGCVVIVRPDQYVAHVLPLDAHAEITAFFDRFMLQPVATVCRSAEYSLPRS